MKKKVRGFEESKYFLDTNVHLPRDFRRHKRHLLENVWKFMCSDNIKVRKKEISITIYSCFAVLIIRMSFLLIEKQEVYIREIECTEKTIE